jgi:two-component system response regulator NreC
MIKVVVADDHQLVRQGICALLDRHGDIQVVGEASDGRAAVEMAKRLDPDVLVMDISMPLLNGIQATLQVRTANCHTQVLILSMYADESLVRQALRFGARGYLLKSGVAEELVLATRAASRGDVYLSPAVSSCVVSGFLGAERDTQQLGPYDLLTPRELEILQLIAEGYTSAAIGAMLGITTKTVEKHRGNLMHKLDAHDLAALVQVALQSRLIFADS